MTGLEGTRLGDYELIERVGGGGMAEVYRAKQLTAFGRDVALKVVRSDLEDSDEFRARFLREAQAISRLSHPNILPLIEFGEEGETLYIVTPLVRGGTLRDLIRQHNGPLPPEEALPLFLQLCHAVQYAHENGIIHRDIKPSNILLQQGAHVLLADFGIARDRNVAQITAFGARIGTLDYMAPEQAQGQADARSDIYSLGVILYQLLTGRLPFEGSTPLLLLVKHTDEALPDPRAFAPTLPPRLVAILQTALAKDPNERFQSASALGNAIQSTQAGAAPHARPGLISLPPFASAPGQATTRTQDTPERPASLPTGQKSRTSGSYSTVIAPGASAAPLPPDQQTRAAQTPQPAGAHTASTQKAASIQHPVHVPSPIPGARPPGADMPRPSALDTRLMAPAPRHKRTGLIVLLALLALVLIVGGAGVLLKTLHAPLTTTTPPTASATRRGVTRTPIFQAFISPDGTFKITYPTSWQRKPSSQLTGTGEEFDGPSGQSLIVGNQGASQTDPSTSVDLFCTSFVLGAPGPHHPVTISQQQWTQEACDSYDGTTHAVVEAVNYKGNTYLMVYVSPKAQFTSDQTRYFAPMEQSFTFLV